MQQLQGQVRKQQATSVRCPERVKDIFIRKVFALKQGQAKSDLQHDPTWKAGKQKALTILVHTTVLAATSSAGE